VRACAHAQVGDRARAGCCSPAPRAPRASERLAPVRPPTHAAAPLLALCAPAVRAPRSRRRGDGAFWPPARCRPKRLAPRRASAARRPPRSRSNASSHTDAPTSRAPQAPRAPRRSSPPQPSSDVLPRQPGARPPAAAARLRPRRSRPPPHARRRRASPPPTVPAGSRGAGCRRQTPPRGVARPSHAALPPRAPPRCCP